MPFIAPQTRRRFLYLGVCLNAFAVYAHTQISVKQIFPLLDKSSGIPSSTAIGIKTCLLIGSASWMTMGESGSEWFPEGTSADPISSTFPAQDSEEPDGGLL